MSIERSAVKLCAAVGIALNSAAPKEIKSTINTSAWLGGLVLALPLYGLDSIIYACIIWGMYKKVANLAGIKFGGKLTRNILGGFIINLIAVFLLNIVLDFIVLFGWIGMFIAGYVITRYSGIAYLGILEAFHGSQNMKVKLDVETGIKSFKEEGGDTAAAKTAANGVIDLFN